MRVHTHTTYNEEMISEDFGSTIFRKRVLPLSTYPHLLSERGGTLVYQESIVYLCVSIVMHVRKYGDPNL